MINEHEHKQEVAEKIREFKNEFPEEYQKERRIEYLKTVTDYYDGEIKKFYFSYDDSLKNNEDYINRAVLAEAIKMREKQKSKHESELRIRFGDNKKFQENKIPLAKERKFSEFIKVKKNMAICPFHADKKPSFSVKNNFGYCFGCGWRGDIIDFIMKLNGFSFKEAINFLT